MIRGVLALASVIAALAIAHVHAQQAPPAAAPARLFGRVVAADTGAPVRSAGIRVVATNPGTGTLVATTDDGGAFDVREVPPGQYVVHVTKPGFVGTRFSLTAGATDPFGVSAGQQIDMRDLRLPRAGVVSGRVSDGFGDPVADIAVVAWRVEYLTPARRRIVSRASFQTNDLGEFRAHGLEPGKYFISAGRSVAGLKEAPTFYPGTPNASEAVSIEVQAGQEATGMQFQMHSIPYGGVSGVVLNSRGAPYQDGVVDCCTDASNNLILEERRGSAGGGRPGIDVATVLRRVLWQAAAAVRRKRSGQPRFHSSG